MLPAASRNLDKSFFGVAGAQGCQLRAQGRPCARPGRRERLRQVDDDEYSRRHPPAGPAADRADGAARSRRRARARRTALGIAFIHQELSLFPNLSIEENLFLDHFPRLRLGLPLHPPQGGCARTRGRRWSWSISMCRRAPRSAACRRGAAAGRDRQGAEPGCPAHHLRRADHLPDRAESDRLFAIIGRLRARGISIIYISHILGDVMRLCDDIVVLRDGQVVAAAPTRRVRRSSACHAHGRAHHRPSFPRSASRPDTSRTALVAPALSAARRWSRTSPSTSIPARCSASPA